MTASAPQTWEAPVTIYSRVGRTCWDDDVTVTSQCSMVAVSMSVLKSWRADGLSAGQWDQQRTMSWWTPDGQLSGLSSLLPSSTYTAACSALRPSYGCLPPLYTYAHTPLTSTSIRSGFVVTTHCTIQYDTIRYDRWFALENWQASCQFYLAHEL